MMTNADNTEPERMSVFQALLAGCGTAADRRNQYIYVGWCLAWAITLTVVTYFLKQNEDFRGPLAYVLASAPFILSIFALQSYLRFLREADELLRKIQMEGLAIGFGAGVLFTLGYMVLEIVGAPEIDVTDVVVVLTVGWMIGQFVATLRYR